MTLQDEKSATYRAAVEATRAETAEGLQAGRLDAVYRRIESDLRAPRHRPAPVLRHLLLGGGALVAATAAALLLLWLAPGPEPSRPGADLENAPVRILMRSGEVALEPEGDARKPGREAVVFTKGLRLSLGERARVDLEIGDTANMAIRGPARFRLPPDRRPRLETGTALFSVNRRPAGAPFTLKAGDSEIVVRGTVFTVRVDGNGSLQRIRVIEGTVELCPEAAGEESRVIHRGESYPAAGTDEPVEPWGRVFEAPWWKTASLAPKTAGHVSVESEPSGAPVKLCGVPLGETPVLVLWSLGTHPIALDKPGYEPFRGSVEVEADRIRRLEVRLAPLAAPALKKPPTARDPWLLASAHLKAGRCRRLERLRGKLIRSSRTADDRARAHMLLAECYLRSGKKRKALAVYRAISKKYGATPSAELALFEAAKLLCELGRRHKALQAFDGYLARYPDGHLAAPATFRRCELLIGFKRLPDARSCLERYRERFPRGRRAQDAVLLLATIARVESRWAEAARLYRDYIGRTPASEIKEEVLYNLASCLHRGKLLGLDRAIDDCLRRFPNGSHSDELRGLKK